jgi:hypothetical protein
VSTGDPIAVAQNPVLHQNYPNPFNPSTSIAFTLPRRMWCRVSVRDLFGATVDVPADGVFDAGTYRAVFQGRDLPAGVYICTMQTDQGSVMKKMLMTK